MDSARAVSTPSTKVTARCAVAPATKNRRQVNEVHLRTWIVTGEFFVRNHWVAKEVRVKAMSHAGAAMKGLCEAKRLALTPRKRVGQVRLTLDGGAEAEARGMMKVAIYARCSTLEQHVDNQLLELRRYTTARGWQVFAEYIDAGVSGIRESRPQLDAMLRDAKRRRFDAVLVAKLDRLGRSLKHLIFLMEELQALGVGLVSLGESIDTTTPAGRLTPLPHFGEGMEKRSKRRRGKGEGTIYKRKDGRWTAAAHVGADTTKGTKLTDSQRPSLGASARHWLQNHQIT